MMGGHLQSLFAQASPDELYDIVILTPRAPLWPILLWILLITLAIGAIAWAVWFFFLSKPPVVPPQPPQEKAKARFRQIYQKASEVPVNELMLEVSDTLKDYLAEKYNDPLRYETTQEFLQRISRQETGLPNAAQQELRGFLVASEELKFGNAPDSEKHSRPLIKAAENVVSLCQTISN